MRADVATGVWDIHTHCYSRRYLRYLEDYGGDYQIVRGSQQTPHIAWRGIPTVTLHDGTMNIAQRFADPIAARVAVHVVSTTIPNVYPLPPAMQASAARAINDELAEWRDQWPDQIRGLASIPMDSDAAVSELERALGDLGLSGVILGTHIEGRFLDDPRYAPFFARANDLKTVILLHPMVPWAGAARMTSYDLMALVGFISDTTWAIAHLLFSGFFHRYPDIRFILPQTGGAVLMLQGRWQAGVGDRSLREQVAGDLRRLYFDTASFQASTLRLAVETVGASHLVFGSDYPHLGNPEVAWQALVEAGLEGEALLNAAHANARALLNH